jgi:hypothetical protein
MIKTTPSSAILVYGTSGGETLTPLRVTEEGSVILDVVQVRANYLELTNENVIPENSEFVHVEFPGVEQTEDGWIDVGPYIRFSMIAVGLEYDEATFENPLPDQPPVFGEEGEIIEPDDTLPPEPPTPDARPTSFDVEMPAGSTYLDVVSAVSSLAPGETLLLPSGTLTAMSPLSIPEGVLIYGADDGTTVFETFGGSSDPVNVIVVNGPDVKLQDLTIRQRKSSNTSVETAVNVTGPGWPATQVDGFTMVNCKLESMEFCLNLRASNFRIEGCEFKYVGPLGNSNRLISLWGAGGNNVIRNNTFYASSDTPTARTREFVYLTSSGASDTYSGCLSMVGNTQMGGNLLRFFLQDAMQGPANGFELVFEDNTFTDLNGGFVLYGVANNFADLYSHITINGNTAANAGKGLLGFDAAASLTAARSTPLPIHSADNVLNVTTVRADWTDISSGTATIARSNLIASASITVDSDVRPAQEPILPE